MRVISFDWYIQELWGGVFEVVKTLFHYNYRYMTGTYFLNPNLELTQSFEKQWLVIHKNFCHQLRRIAGRKRLVSD